MVALPLPSSIRLQTNTPPVSSRVRCSLFAAANTTYQTKQPHNNNISVIARPNKLVRDRVLFKEYDDRKALEEVLQNEADTAVQRLKMAVEALIDSEVKKFTSRVDEELGPEGRKMLMEEMSREIVAKFWEKPIQYLESGDGKLEQKLKHLNFLVRVLEQSCVNNQR